MKIPKTSNDCSFSGVVNARERLKPLHHRKRADPLVFDGEGVMEVTNKQPPPKTSKRARFRWQKGGGGGKQEDTIENEQMRSFSMVKG